MWWLVSALGAGGAIAALLGLWRVSVWKDRASTYEAQLAVQRRATERALREGEQAAANAADQVARVESVVGWYKVQLKLVSKDLDACTVPGAVRDSLRGMLSGPPRGQAPAPATGVHGAAGPTPAK